MNLLKYIECRLMVGHPAKRAERNGEDMEVTVVESSTIQRSEYK